MKPAPPAPEVIAFLHSEEGRDWTRMNFRAFSSFASIKADHDCWGGKDSCGVVTVDWWADSEIREEIKLYGMNGLPCTRQHWGRGSS